jgi:hypothetical protein
MALAISIALDDLDAEEKAKAPPPKEPESVAPVEIPPAPEPAPAPPSAPPPAPRPTTHVDLSVSLGPTVSVGTAPVPVVGGSASATLGYGLVAARASFRAEFAGTESLMPTGTLSTQTLVGTLEACLRTTWLFGCAGAGVGSIATETSGITHRAVDRGLLAPASATAGVRLRLGGGFYFEPFAEGTVNLVAERVDVDGRAAYTVPRIAGILGGHMGLQFF